MRVIEVEEDDEANDAKKEHHNHQYGGYCCPHCLKTNQHTNHLAPEVRCIVVCDHCGERFVIWDEETVDQCSGKLPK